MEAMGEGASALDAFYNKGLITCVLYEVKSGKEATVYCCQAHPSTGVERLAAKVYRSSQRRQFHNDALYREGRYVSEPRLKRAIRDRTHTGREAAFAMWVEQEYRVLTELYAVGASVPRPWARTDDAVLLEFVGDAGGPAPLLQQVRLAHDEARGLFYALLDEVALWLHHNTIHADLSAYNILYWRGRLRVIDLPQAVDPRFNGNAEALLARDFANICKHFARYGIVEDPARLAGTLWYRWLRGEPLVVGRTARQRAEERHG